MSAIKHYLHQQQESAEPTLLDAILDMSKAHYDWDVEIKLNGGKSTGIEIIRSYWVQPDDEKFNNAIEDVKHLLPVKRLPISENLFTVLPGAIPSVIAEKIAQIMEMHSLRARINYFGH